MLGEGRKQTRKVGIVAGHLRLPFIHRRGIDSRGYEARPAHEPVDSAPNRAYACPIAGEVDRLQKTYEAFRSAAADASQAAQSKEGVHHPLENWIERVEEDMTRPRACQATSVSDRAENLIGGRLRSGCASMFFRMSQGISCVTYVHRTKGERHLRERTPWSEKAGFRRTGSSFRFGFPTLARSQVRDMLHA